MKTFGFLLGLALLGLANGDKFSSLEVQEESMDGLGAWEDFLRPKFTHGKDEYTHEKAQVFRAFSGFHELLDQVSGETIQELKWQNEKRYVSREMVRMRDGVHLSTIVIRPTLDDNDKRPALLARSPYGPTSDQVATIFMATNGFVAVIQDQRGTFLSEGNFSMWRNDGADGYDTMEWISKQSWSNGEVFSSGISADGCGALTQVTQNPPWLKGQFIMLASANAHETVYPGGAFRQGLVEGWMSAMSIFTKGYSLTHTLPEIMRHEAMSSWYDTVEADKYYQYIKWPTVHVSAWYDIFAGHHLRAYDELLKQSDKSVRNNHTLFVTPFGHCFLDVARDNLDLSIHEAKGWINAFGFAMEEFSKRYDGKYHQKVKKINFFVQGPYFSDGNRKKFGNFWASAEEWPEATPTKLFLSGGHELKFEESNTPVNQLIKSGEHEYTYSPHKTIRTNGGNNLILMLLGDGCGPTDHSHIEEREDVIVFTTAKPFQQPFAVTGRIYAELYVSSDRDDTDFFVSLNDVYPDGRHYKSVQIRYGIQRMRWRDGAEKEAPPMEKDSVYKITIDMWPTSYIFEPGHRLRVTVSSSNHPYYYKNPNIHEPLPYQRPDVASIPAKNRIHFSDQYPSHILLPVVDYDELVKLKNDKF